MRVLIAEDSPLERNMLQDAVAVLGHECLVAADGAEAWQLFSEFGADVVISDWMMPGVDGLELCRRVRADTREAYTYFVFLTRLEDRPHALQGMEAGADDYLVKPLDLDDLHLRLIAAERVTMLHRRLAEAKLMEGRLEGVTLAGRALAHLLSNNLLQVAARLEALESRPNLPPELAAQVSDAALRLNQAVEHVERLQHIVRVETQETPAGPILDLQRSAEQAEG
jgi:two-component system, cell cycle response regulator